MAHGCRCSTLSVLYPNVLYYCNVFKEILPAKPYPMFTVIQLSTYPLRIEMSIKIGMCDKMDKNEQKFPILTYSIIQG